MGSKNAGVGFSLSGGGGVGALPFAIRADGGQYAIFSDTADRDNYYTGHPEELLNTPLGRGLEAVGISSTAPTPDGLTSAYMRNSTNTGWVPIATNFIGPQGDKGDKGDQGDNVIQVMQADENVGGPTGTLNFKGTGVSVTEAGDQRVITVNQLDVRDANSTVGAAAILAFEGPGVTVTGSGGTKVVLAAPPLGVGPRFALALTSGDANNIEITVDSFVTAYTTRLTVFFRARRSNTGPVTLNVNGLGAQPLLNSLGEPVAAAEMVPFAPYVAAWTGTRFMLLNDLAIPIDRRPSKLTLDNDDYLLIEDSADGFAKKKISVATLVAHITGGT